MWREKYDFLQVLPTSGNAALEGLYREANSLPPAGTKSDGNKKAKVGARDVAIWLTAVEFAWEHPDETVYFVSENHKDFTKGGAGYPAPMDSDIADLGERFVHLTNLAELLETLAPRVQVDAADPHGLLEQHTEWLADRIRRIRAMNHTPFEIRTRDGETTTAQAWMLPDDVRVQLMDVRDIDAYRLGTNGWIVATARWEFVGLAIAKTLVQGACTMETRILFPTQSGDEHRPQVIKSYVELPAEDASAVDWPPLMQSAEYMQRVLQNAEAEGRKPTWVEVLLSALMAFPLLKQSSSIDLSQYPAYQPLQLKHLLPLLPGTVEDEQPEDKLDEE